ncbi:unnamed protein product [Somion occarium]|uniref:Uncharacterized protein n=1 Tax=Somion occarium TaxID=3059160 RepID=A0ABP1CWV8_9APHY
MQREKRTHFSVHTMSDLHVIRGTSEIVSCVNTGCCRTPCPREELHWIDFYISLIVEEPYTDTTIPQASGLINILTLKRLQTIEVFQKLCSIFNRVVVQTVHCRYLRGPPCF